ncbi:MAG TPA: VanZ family protein, partial [Longimicrobiales bacterium]
NGAACLSHSIQPAAGELQLELTCQATYGAIQVFVRRLGRDGVLLNERVQPPNVIGEAFEQDNALLRDGAEFSGHVRKIAESGILATHPSAKEAVVSRVIAYAPAMVWAVLLLFVGGRSDVPTVDTPLPLDKAAHFLLYGLLGVLATLGWRRARFWPHLALPIACAIAVGAADELNQRSVNGRSSDVADWFADTAGILTGCWLVVRKSKEISNAD